MRRAPAGGDGPARIAGLRAEGKSFGQIVAEMGLPKTTVARIVAETAA